MIGYRALLDALARPRLVGTSPHAAVRETLKRELEARGCVVLEHRFRATPRFPLWGRAVADGITLIAVRPRVRVGTWLTAHYDSKGQPLSMAGRLLLLAAAVAVLPVVFVAVLMSASAWWWLAVVPLPSLFLALNVVTDHSPGAVDNASGVVTVLSTLDRLSPDSPVGVILLDAEELGLAGARALVRERANLLQDTAVINFDGIDDRGNAIVFVHRPGALTARLAQRLRASPRRRLPVVVDGSALAAATRECCTIMKGDWGTTRIVHSPRDSADRLTLTGVESVAQAVVACIGP